MPSTTWTRRLFRHGTTWAVACLLAQAEAADAAKDAEYGTDRHGDDLPAELQRREGRLKRIREAKRVLEARAREEAAAAGQPAESPKPDPKAQYNFTDPESRIMKGPDGFVQAYNVQVAVDDLQLIVGQAVTQETNDKKQLMPTRRAMRPPHRTTCERLCLDCSGFVSRRGLKRSSTTRRLGSIGPSRLVNGTGSWTVTRSSACGACGRMHSPPKDDRSSESSSN